jgi:hypothetical protein
MQDWMLAEWDALQNTQNTTVPHVHSYGVLTVLEDNAAIMHQLHERQEYLASLCAAWQDAVLCIPS